MDIHAQRSLDIAAGTHIAAWSHQELDREAE